MPGKDVSSMKGPATTNLCSECNLRMSPSALPEVLSPASLLGCGAFVGRFRDDHACQNEPHIYPKLGSIGKAVCGCLQSELYDRSHADAAGEPYAGLELKTCMGFGNSNFRPDGGPTPWLFHDSSPRTRVKCLVSGQARTSPKASSQGQARHERSDSRRMSARSSS